MYWLPQTRINELETFTKMNEQPLRKHRSCDREKKSKNLKHEEIGCFASMGDSWFYSGTAIVTALENIYVTLRSHIKFPVNSPLTMLDILRLIASVFRLKI